MSVKQISNDDLKNIGVIGLDDAPGLSKADMQAKFEETSRSVIIPRLNETIADHNKLAEEVESLTLNSGNVSLEQMEYWDSKLDATPESYRRLTKFCVVGGSVGWFKVGSVNLTEPLERYSAQIVVQSVHTNSEKGKMGCLSAEICVNADRTRLDGTSHITWSEASEFDDENVMVNFDAETLTAVVYICTEAVTERIAIAVLLENNPTNAEHLLITSSNNIAELTEPIGMRSKKKSSMVLLWENASPTSEFVTQTINLDLNEYHFVLTRFRISDGDSAYQTNMVRVGEDGYPSLITANTNDTFSRRYRVNSTFITFYTAYKNKAVNNLYMIPTRVYGIKY